MTSSTMTVRVDTPVLKKLEKLSKSTGRSRSFLAAAAITEYVEINAWQVAGIERAIASLDRGEGISHEEVRRRFLTPRPAAASPRRKRAK